MVISDIRFDHAVTGSLDAALQHGEGTADLTISEGGLEDVDGGGSHA